MTTPQDTTNTTERDPRPSGSPPDESRRGSGPEKKSGMPHGRTWLWFALILLANFLIVRLLFPGLESSVEVPYTSVQLYRSEQSDPPRPPLPSAWKDRFYSVVQWYWTSG